MRRYHSSERNPTVPCYHNTVLSERSEAFSHKDTSQWFHSFLSPWHSSALSGMETKNFVANWLDFSIKLRRVDDLSYSNFRTPEFFGVSKKIGILGILEGKGYVSESFFHRKLEKTDFMWKISVCFCFLSGVYSGPSNHSAVHPGMKNYS